MLNPHIQKYLTEVQSQLSTGIAKEHAYRPALKNLLTALFPKIKAVNDAKKIDVGAPDFHLLSGETPVGYIEAKDIGLDLDDKNTQAQTKRYIEGLANVVLTDYLEFRWYLIDTKKPRYTVVLAEKKGNKIIPIEGRDEALVNLLDQFISTEDARTVKSAKELAKRMANLAKIIRDIISAALKIDDESTQLHETMKSFKDVLLHDLDDEKFADMYAQTICYGMFAARVNHNIGKSKFERKTAGYDLPKTNPFLRQLFNTIAGPELDDRVIWAVDDLANLLHHAAMEDILKDFGKRTRQEDPVVHFYETFLAAYDPKLRESRGVYYTPEPVVSYIVRSVDHILKTDFGLEKGLADSTKIKSPSPGTPGEGRGEGDLHKVLILDPACGTGTFLHGVIDQIHENFKGNQGAWSSYVSEHLLPRIFGFELLMAPYAVAHLKLGLQLKELGYDFESDERLGVYLTNTLDEVFTLKEDEKSHVARWLANEANASNNIKRDLPIMVVMGNPPYSGTSANASSRPVYNTKTSKYKDEITWIGKLIKDYYLVDGVPLGEKNPKYLQDDYVKFIRFAQWRIEKTGFGVLAFITNNGYLENPTFRGMRQNLTKTFDDIYILNLHGSSKKKEQTKDGGKDENVFDIQQGVSIGIFVKRKLEEKKATNIYHSEILGNRQLKYDKLFSEDITSTNWKKINPSKPFYLFKPQLGKAVREEYNTAFLITHIFDINTTGIKTHRDHMVLDFDLNELQNRIKAFRNSSISNKKISDDFELKDTRDWKIDKQRKKLIADSNWDNKFTNSLYRPFDFRHMYYSGVMIELPREEVMTNFINHSNLAIITTRSIEIQRGWEHIFCSKVVADHHSASLKETNYVFPLYIYNSNVKKDLFSEGDGGSSPSARKPNLSPEFIQEMEKRLGMKFALTPTLSRSTGRGSFTPEDIFHYMYAVFHSQTYRTRYAEFLKIDFPRLPLTSDVKLFTTLAKLGEELVKLHLMEEPHPNPLLSTGEGARRVKFPKKGSDVVEVCRFESDSGHNRVYINADQYFEVVPEAVWNFHIGGYQVAHKWLKDRKGRKLSYDDIAHYGKIISALWGTMQLMKLVDDVILGAGGFPMK